MQVVSINKKIKYIDIMSFVGIDPVGAIISGISAINNIKLAQVYEKALLEEVLEELIFNLKLVQIDYIKNGAELESVIPLLKITRLESAERARKRKKLDFNKIKAGTINYSSFISNSQLKYYSSFDSEKVFLKLRDKIIEIKKVRKLYYYRGRWRQGVNPKRRMNNIVDIFGLISNHLSEK